MSDGAVTAEILPLSASVAVAQMHEAVAYQRYLEARANIDSILAASPYSKLFAAVETLFIALGQDLSTSVRIDLICHPQTGLDDHVEDELQFVDPRVAKHAVSERVRLALDSVLRDLSARLQFSSPQAITLELDGLDLRLQIVTPRDTHALTVTCGAPFLVLDKALPLTGFLTPSLSVGGELVGIEGKR